MIRSAPLIVPAAMLASLAILAGCGKPEPEAPVSDIVPLDGVQATDGPSIPTPAASGPSAPYQPARPSGPPVSVQVTTDEGTLQAAYVTNVVELPGQDAKLFSTAGGDPAMNGLYTHLAIFQGAHEPWKVFRIGDFEAWKVVEQTPGRVVLEVRESTLDADTGDIGSTTKKLIVQWSGTDATALIVTPAQ